MKDGELIVAIDPGKNGAIVTYDVKMSQVEESIQIPATPKDISDFFDALTVDDRVISVYMEEPSGFIGGFGRAVSGVHVFWRQFGNIESSIISAGHRLLFVRPQAWQKALGLKKEKSWTTSQWKNKLKAMAQRLYPGVKITLQNADAILILEYVKRRHLCETKTITN